MGKFVKSAERSVRSVKSLFEKPKAPRQTAQEKELERRQRRELDELTRDENARLKSLKRGRIGRRQLLGSGGERGIRPGLGASGVRGPSRSGNQGGGIAAAAVRRRAGLLGGVGGGGGSFRAISPGLGASF